MKRTPLLLLLAISFALMAASCSCQQRMQRMQRHCPECFQVDTVRLVDTVVPEPVPIIARIPWSDLTAPAPVVVGGRNFTLTIVSDGDGILIDGQAIPDTIVRLVEVPVRVPVIVREDDRRAMRARDWVAAALVALLCAWGIIRAIKR